MPDLLPLGPRRVRVLPAPSDVVGGHTPAVVHIKLAVRHTNSAAARKSSLARLASLVNQGFTSVDVAPDNFPIRGVVIFGLVERD